MTNNLTNIGIVYLSLFLLFVVLTKAPEFLYELPKPGKTFGNIC